MCSFPLILIIHYVHMLSTHTQREALLSELWDGAKRNCIILEEDAVALNGCPASLETLFQLRS